MQETRVALDPGHVATKIPRVGQSVVGNKTIVAIYLEWWKLDAVNAVPKSVGFAVSDFLAVKREKAL